MKHIINHSAVGKYNRSPVACIADGKCSVCQQLRPILNVDTADKEYGDGFSICYQCVSVEFMQHNSLHLLRMEEVFKDKEFINHLRKSIESYNNGNFRKIDSIDDL